VAKEQRHKGRVDSGTLLKGKVGGRRGDRGVKDRGEKRREGWVKGESEGGKGWKAVGGVSEMFANCVPSDTRKEVRAPVKFSGRIRPNNGGQGKGEMMLSFVEKMLQVSTAKLAKVVEKVDDRPVVSLDDNTTRANFSKILSGKDYSVSGTTCFRMGGT